MNANANKMSELVSAALAVKTVGEADALEAIFRETAGGLVWKPVGGIDDNIGAINASRDPRLTLNERFTNSIDAVLELHARLTYGTDVSTMASDLVDPRHAAHVLLGVPDIGPGKMSVKDRQLLAEDIQMDLLDSGDEERPTCVIRDRGIGQSPESIADTILSIHRGNKRDKPFLMGLYGWGGSNALSFAERTVIVSRRHPQLLDGGSSGAALTFVKQIYEDSMRTPAYFYAATPAGEILSVDPDLLAAHDFEYGTQIAHVAYQLHINGPLINQFKYFSTALFEPVLPVYLGSYRKAEKHSGRRTIIGTGGRLRSAVDDDDQNDSSSSKTKVAYTRSARIDLQPSEGHVDVTYWVLEKEGALPNAEIALGYVAADSAIVVTLGGQSQETEKREWIKRNCRLPHLYKRMVIQIGVDNLSREAKVEAFATTREGLRGPMRDRIFGDLQELLIEDQSLNDLELTLREEALKHTAEKASDKDLEKLAKAIGKLGGRTREADVGVEVPAGGQRSKGSRERTPRDTSDEHLPEIPTEFTFDRHAVSIEQGGSKRRLVVTVNAKNGYLPAHEADLSIVVEGPNGDTRDVYPHTRAGLLGGEASWLLSADASAALGDYKLSASLLAGEVQLSDSVTITVIEGRDDTGNGSHRGRRKKKVKQKRQVPAGPDVRWIPKSEWDLHDFTSSSVGRVDEGGASVDILLNVDFDKLEEVLTNPRHTTAVIEARKSAYMVPTALGLYRIHQLEQEGEIEDKTVQRLQGIVADSVLLATDSETLLGPDDSE